MPGGEGFEEHDELLSHEAAVELVRKRASAERGRGEPDSVAPFAHRERVLPFMLPDPNLGGGPRAFLKRSVARLTRWQTVPLLRQLNEVRVEHHERLAAQEARSQELSAGLEELKQAFDRVDREAEELADQQLRTSQLAASLEAVKQNLDQRLDDLRGGLSWLNHLRAEDRAELTSALARIRAGAEPRPAAAGEAADTEGSTHLEAFYGAHQERFRGSREFVRRRLEIYLPQVQSVAGADHRVLDLGPGRGEWLALLRDRGIAAYGVDVNSSFVASAGEIGLDVRHQDAVEHLRSLPDGSLAAVTAFHLVEHLSPAALIELVDNALRALRPGGLLILETPNPLNLKVGAASFHLDPTHVRPIHPLFLEFVLENRGFAE
ncbi:MAG: methyltransferase domain-containing protein, partial [Candidatus Dormibacteraeota bacterium]|nr:methyltransferase domain-containing protein [Candidatus Dormibacteraeota bacterium]